MAIESPPCHLTGPPHTRLQTHTKGATPKPKPPGWWLGRFPQPKPHTPWPYNDRRILSGWVGTFGPLQFKKALCLIYI
ncbi:hypothetical protein HanRHA438_Chr03g0137011 [Helianthus annuus]|nr:hypothetical protein HanRHA438_Chr03g0137011 [Helianthus annuus]